jgi:hypothetical protein
VYPEELNLSKCRPDVRPSIMGRTFVAISDSLGHEEILTDVKSVWAIIASWGRYWDDVDSGRAEEEGYSDSFLSEEEYMEQLPDLLHDRVPWFANMMDLLHHRDWMWWSSIATLKLIKIDLLVESMPHDVRPVAGVIEACGGEIVYNSRWIGLSDAEKLVGESK